MRTWNFRLAFLFLFLFSNPVFSDVLDLCRTGDIVDCLKNLFIEASQHYRPSSKEEGIRNWMIALVEKANARFWVPSGYGPVTYRVDRTGNLVFYIPATGQYAQRGLPPIALQTHLDMVLKAAVKPGESIVPYFERGIDLVETDGWIHSRNFKTTIGLDNFGGGAIQLAYAINPYLRAHPELESIHTTEEETTMNGAKGLDLSTIQAPVLINIDGDDPSQFIYGCMSTDMVLARGRLDTVEIPDGYRLYRATISGLMGGHSGQKIVESRLNAIRGMANALTSVRDSFFRAVNLISLKGGELNAVSGLPVMNIIPEAAEMFFAVKGEIGPETVIENMEHAIGEQVITHRKENTEKKVVVTVTLEQRVGHSRMLSEVRSSFILGKLTALRNGVLEWVDEARTEAHTSSNLSYFNVEFDGDEAAITLGYMLRALSTSNQRQFVSQNSNLIRSRWNGISIKNLSSTPAWVSSPDGWLPNIARSLGMTGYSALGGLEAAIFAEPFRERGGKIISVAALRITNEHAPTESGNVASWGTGFHNIGHMMDLIVRQPEYTNACMNANSL